MAATTTPPRPLAVSLGNPRSGVFRFSYWDAPHRSSDAPNIEILPLVCPVVPLFNSDIAGDRRPALRRFPRRFRFDTNAPGPFCYFRTLSDGILAQPGMPAGGASSSPCVVDCSLGPWPFQDLKTSRPQDPKARTAFNGPTRYQRTGSTDGRLCMQPSLAHSLHTLSTPLASRTASRLSTVLHIPPGTDTEKTVDQCSQPFRFFSCNVCILFVYGYRVLISSLTLLAIC